jgi:hypothetical protein
VSSSWDGDAKARQRRRRPRAANPLAPALHRSDVERRHDGAANRKEHRMNEGIRKFSGSPSYKGSEIRENMRVLSSDGQPIGEVDHLEDNDTIKLKRKDSIDGRHHYLSVDHVMRVEDDAVVLSLSFAEAQKRLSEDTGHDAAARAFSVNPQPHRRSSDASTVDQKEGTAIGQNPDEPDRMVS